MQLPKLTPLQARLLASLVAMGVLVVIWIEFQSKYGVYAAELPSALEDTPIRIQEGGNGKEDTQRILSHAPIIEAEEEANEDMGYTPDFAYFDRSLIGRAVPQGAFSLSNNEKRVEDSDPGVTRYFVLEKSQLKLRKRDGELDPLDEEEDGASSSLEARSAENTSEKRTGGEMDPHGVDEDGEPLRKRQSATKQVWISANSCRQPAPEASTLITSDPPQLTLYVSTSSKNQNPGPNSVSDPAVKAVPFQGGYANFTLNTTSDTFIGVSAPNLTDGWAGSWRFEIAASLDNGYYHSYNMSDTFLFMVDTDSESALFITQNITSNSTTDIEKWARMDPFPFIMYTQLNDNWGPMTGLERSFCALQEALNATTNTTVAHTVTTKFGGEDRGKAQFHVQGLKNGTAYSGFLAINGTAAGLQVEGLGNMVMNGGLVMKQFNWTTKADDSCQVIFDLPFCSSVAWAVPSNTLLKRNQSGLIALYDDLALSYYQNFTKSLDQVACDTTGTAQYSLARNCTHCAEDYKAWLCTVLMPRCEDFSAASTDSRIRLQPRNIQQPFPWNGSYAYSTNTSSAFNETTRDRFAYSQSRNPMIDAVIKPGPYKELLPCEDLCFDIVRSCPAQLGFSCPNEPARSLTYGRKSEDVLACNFPGAVVDLNVRMGGAMGRSIEGVVVVVVAVAMVVAWSLWI